MRLCTSWIHILASITLLLLLLVAADGVGDLAMLRDSITNKAGNITALSNSTAAGSAPFTVGTFSYRTAQSMLGDLTAQLGTAQQNVQTDQTSWINGQTLPLDGPYLDFSNTFFSLSQALTSLSKLAHSSDLNPPIVQGIAAVSDQYHTYASYLYDRNIISRSSWIRSLSAMSSLASAEGPWSAGNGTQAR
ncbi:hypothetical protein NA57DRAFT_73675 [Rhizodiscina lignyota]|uniref:Uncharacterized protein n=1 Tax=Rhizodiscina lignyota TaxID=1504668 RepID=A0A9P4IMP4_9PEZI|nr:hypothetical protein NA57DRAFT_73675 [Rhizodiscina lignyota]